MGYIFDINKPNIAFDYKLLSKIEDNLGIGITNEEARYLLEWIMYKVKSNIDDETLSCKCGEAGTIEVLL